MRTRTMLSRDLSAVSLDPFTLEEAGPCSLPAGTWVEGAAVAVNHAETCGLKRVILRVLRGDNWVELKRVAVSDLKRAIEGSHAG